MFSRVTFNPIERHSTENFHIAIPFGLDDRCSDFNLKPPPGSARSTLNQMYFAMPFDGTRRETVRLKTKSFVVKYKNLPGTSNILKMFRMSLPSVSMTLVGATNYGMASVLF